MLTLGDILDVVLYKSYIEVYTAKDSEDHTIWFSGTEDKCPEELKDMEVMAVFANGEPDDECLYIGIQGSYCVNVIGKLGDDWEIVTNNFGCPWETVSCWENLIQPEAMALFENVKHNHPAIFRLDGRYTELEFQLWDDNAGPDALLVSNIELNAN